MKPRFPLVLFDLDGTLVDSFADIVAGIEVACRAIGVPPTEHLLKLATRGAPLEDFYRDATRAEPAGERFVRFVEGYRAHYRPGAMSRTVAYPGIPEVLRALRGLEPRPAVGVATTKRTAIAEYVVAQTGLAPLVDVTMGSDGLAPKPSPAVLLEVARRAGVPLVEGVMIGDTDRDVGAARAGGCVSVAVTWGGFSAEELRALAPDHLVTAPDQLLPILTR